MQTSKYAENRISMILVPKVGLEDVEHTLAPAVRARAIAAVGGGGATSARKLVAKPSKAVAPTLRKLGLVDEPSVKARIAAKASLGKGLFRTLPSLGLTVAMFDDDGVADRARDGLGQEYDMVPDFRLGMTRPASRSAAAPPRGSTNWPAISGIKQARSKGLTGAGAPVGVFDTGIDADHREFEGRHVGFTYVSFYPYDSDWGTREVRGFDTHGHGTHVSGIICGKTVGIAPNCDLTVSAVIESETITTSATRAVYALNKFYEEFLKDQHRSKAAIVNMSLGFGTEHLSRADHGKQLQLMRRIFRDMLEANILPIVAVGNSGPHKAEYPSVFDEALAVGAVDHDMTRASFSATGKSLDARAPRPDIYGFGVDIVSSMERDTKGKSRYEQMSGTSMATPYVSGIAALYLQENPRLTAPELKSKLVETATAEGVARYGAPPAAHARRSAKRKVKRSRGRHG